MNKAFTLVELAIVLVIIGLLVSGVLAGKDLIAASKINNAVSKFKSYDTATAAFYAKYNCWPGDCKRAGSYGMLPRTVGVSGFGCGNGDNQVSSYFVADDEYITALDFSIYAICSNDESQLFWSDLSYSGLIEGSYGESLTGVESVAATLPVVLDDAYVIASNGDANESVAPFGYTLVGYVNAINEDQFDNFAGGDGYFPLSVEEAYAIDSKIDNGSPISGKVYTFDQIPAFNTYVVKGALSGCSIDNGDGTSMYDFSSTSSTACYIKIRSSVF